MDVNFTTTKGLSRLNPFLIKQQNLNQEEVDIIKQLHIVKDQLLDELEKKLDFELIKRIEDLEFELQIAWKFTTREKGFNRDYYRFWRLPFCECAKLDNDDNFGTGYYYVSGACPIHGKNLEN